MQTFSGNTLIAAAGATALLAGCAGSADPCNPTAMPAFPPQADDQCAATELSRHVGSQPTGEVRAEIAAKLGDRRVRYIAPGDVVTMDYSPSRLNVELGADGRIARLHCG